ncbi:MAG: NAD(P)-dependent oxidoreductase [Patescibacteria group bacterium]|nr:NAD(P)-dependent oxidoreductase [Patescibacteria group bacterium]
MNVGIIGTGLLGSAIARRIATSGHNVHAYNRTRQKAESLEKSGIVIEDSPTELAKKCDVVITIVKDVQAIEEVSFGKNGIVNGKHKGLVVADMSTINPISSRKIAKKFSDNGISMIDAPVMGGPSLAEKGKMTIMVGGKK